MKSIEYKDAKITYSETGNGDTTLLFVHGSFINKEYWDSQVKFFASKYKVIAIDLPGHGESTSGSDSLKIQNFGNVLVAFIKELKLKNVILIGHSMGADVILETGVKYPEPLAGLIVVDYFKNVGTPLPKEIQEQALAGLKTDFKKTVSAYAHQGLLTPKTDSSVVNRVIRDYQAMDPIKGYTSIADQFAYTKRETELLEKLSLKVNLINTDYQPNNEESLKKHIPAGYSSKIIHGTSHFPMIENPNEFNEALQSTIDQLGK